ncbi:hypothetical protein CPAR01_12892 [Colletotrichum paranaense]|uniref:Uncharacterized protein n=1 Tax=Colletotrichum paranaense TaxID=1914294 RepID=A0ABQ9S7Q6_9PEZI|nr:uncharacterized protein CPAR01_12892 [Colletotrichum paranaense]KAK1528334.1 hypothetical protein CPAR01_12892 [Colletotrichum paranaense]
MIAPESRRAARPPPGFCVRQWPPRVHRTTRSLLLARPHHTRTGARGRERC